MSDSEEQAQGHRLSPKALAHRVMARAHRLWRRKDREIARNRFLAFVVIVAYGLILSAGDLRERPFATILGALIFGWLVHGLVRGLLGDDPVIEATDDERLQRLGGGGAAGE